LVIRPERRAGVSGSRILAAKKATGDVLLFTDPHCDYPEHALADLSSRAYTEREIVQPKTVTKWANKNRPRFGGRLDLCDRGLRVGRQYNATGPHPALIGTIYAIRRNLYDMLGGWPKLPGFWGCSEQALTLMAWFAGVRIAVDERYLCCHHDYHPVGKDGRQKFAYPVPLSSHADNCTFVHAAFFPATFANYFKPMIDNHFRKAKINHRAIFKSWEFKRTRSLIGYLQQRTEEEWFHQVLQMQMPGIASSNGTAKEYIDQQRKKSKPKDYPTTRRQKYAIDWLERNIPGCYRDKSVLDLGSRDGFATEYVIKTAGKKDEKGRPLGKGAHECLGVELVPETAEYARKKGRNVRQGDMQHLDLPPNNYHIVQAIHSLEHVPDHKLALDEMVRVCKPGGWMLVVVPRETKPSKKHAHNHAWPTMESLVETIQSVKGIDRDSIKNKVRPLKDQQELRIAFRKARR